MRPPAPATIRLTDLLGDVVLGPGDGRTGRIADLVVTLDDVFPAVHEVVLRTHRRRTPVAVPVDRFTTLAPGATRIDAPPGEAAPGRGLLLQRDVLDTQVVDTTGRRLARVADVDLTWQDGVLRVIAVDVGWRAILRRLGLHRLARRASRDAIDWAGVHLASGPGHPLQLAAPSAAVHRLDPAELAELLARLPALRAGEVLDTLGTAPAAAALGTVDPELGADLVEVLTPERALALLRRLGDAQAADALRAADPERRALLLDALDPARADALRTLILGPPTAVADAPRPRRRYWNILRGHKGFLR